MSEGGVVSPGRPDGPDPVHRPPPGVDRQTIDALGTLSEALETAERARGCLYAFHQLTGSADLTLGRAVRQLGESGHAELAQRLDRELLGRNVISGRWTFQIIEDYDDHYWSLFRSLERDVRQKLVGGRRHLYEAAMKEARRTPGAPGHEAVPHELPPAGQDGG